MSNPYPYQESYPITPLTGDSTMEDVLQVINEIGYSLTPELNVFYENENTVITSYSPPEGSNAIAAGPIQVNYGVILDVTPGSTLTIV